MRRVFGSMVPSARSRREPSPSRVTCWVTRRTAPVDVYSRRALRTRIARLVILSASRAASLFIEWGVAPREPAGTLDRLTATAHSPVGVRFPDAFLHTCLGGTILNSSAWGLGGLSCCMKSTGDRRRVGCGGTGAAAVLSELGRLWCPSRTACSTPTAGRGAAACQSVDMASSVLFAGHAARPSRHIRALLRRRSISAAGSPHHPWQLVDGLVCRRACEVIGK